MACKTIKAIAIMGRPMNNAGLLIPAFQLCNGSIIQSGDTRDTGVLLSDLEQMASEGAAILINPLPVRNGLTEDILRNRESNGDRYGLPAQIVYFHKTILQVLNWPSYSGMATKDGGHKLCPLTHSRDFDFYNDFSFYLFERNSLKKKFLPVLLDRCRDIIEEKLIERIANQNKNIKYFVSGEEDELVQLAQVMMNLAATKKEIETAIKYQGLFILKSPKAENWRRWISFVKKKWGLWGNDDDWKESSYGLFDKAEAQVGFRTMPKKEPLQPYLPSNISKISSGGTFDPYWSAAYNRPSHIY